MTPDNSRPRIGLLAIRVSSDRQGTDGDSPEAQREQGERYAATHGIVITETIILMESASHEEQPMQKVINACKAKSKGIEIVLIKSIDRFTRGGGDYYSPLKKQLTVLGVSLIDMYGVIGQQQVNTLEHTGFKYYWSEFNPSQKSEYLEAERAKDEMRDIMSRMIGAEIRYTQLGYWMRMPPYGFMSETVDTNNGKRTILRPHPEEFIFVQRLFKMRAKGIYSSQEIADALNRLGFRTRINYVRDKYDRTKILRIVGGKKMDVKMVDRFAHRLVYAGVIKEKWTYDKAVKAQFDGLVTPELFNQANHGKLVIEIASNNEVTVHHKLPPQYQLVKRMLNPSFPYKKVIGCPHCNKTLSGSAARGKLGKYYPAYHCSRDGHYFRIPKAEFDATIERLIKSIEIAPEHIDTLLSMVEESWRAQQQQTVQDDQKLSAQRQTLEAQIRVTVDRMKVVTSETAIKYMEEDIVNAENQIKELDGKLANKSENAVNIDLILQYAKYLLKHLSAVLLDLSNPLRRAAFFGAIFNEMPNYEDLVFETHKKSPLPKINGLFRLVTTIESTSGGPGGTRTHDILLKRQTL
jgi:hypothetical protein